MPDMSTTDWTVIIALGAFVVFLAWRWHKGNTRNLPPAKNPPGPGKDGKNK